MKNEITKQEAKAMIWESYTGELFISDRLETVSAKVGDTFEEALETIRKFFLPSVYNKNKVTGHPVNITLDWN